MRLVLLLFLLGSITIFADSSNKAGLEDPNARSRWIQSTYENKSITTPNNFNIRQQRFSNSLPNAPEGLFSKGNQISSQTWLHAGPDNVGGRTRIVEYDKTNSNIIIAGGVSGGIWRSIDGGKSWVQTTGITEIASVTAILQDPRPGKNNIWYCAGGEHKGNSASLSRSFYYTGNGIFKSTDNGITWEPYGNTGDHAPENINSLDIIYRLAIDPTNLKEDILFAACVGSVYKISDNGQKIDVAFDMQGYNEYNFTTDLVITQNGKYFATLSYASYYKDESVSHSGIFYSEDGIHWKDISPEFLQPSYRIFLDYARSNENILYFFSANVANISSDCDTRYDECYSLFKLDKKENERTWTNLSHNIPYFEAKNSFNHVVSSEGYMGAIKIAPNDPNKIILAGANCYISYDGFNTNEKTQWIAGYNSEWNEYILFDTTKTIIEKYMHMMNNTFPTGGWDHHWFTFNPDNANEVIAATDHGLHKLQDISENSSKEWIDLNNGYYTTQFFDCAINKYVAGSDDILGGTQDNGTLANFQNGSNFSTYLPGDGYTCDITKDNSLIVTSQYGQIYRLDLNNGMVYNGAFLTPPNISDLNPQQHSLFTLNTQNNKEMTIATNSHIAICNDITSPHPESSFEIHPIDHLNPIYLQYGYSPEKVLYVATRNKLIIKITDFSQDNFSYETIKLPEFVSGNFILNLWVNPDNSENFFAIVSNYLSLGMLETTDGGETWTDHGGNLEENPDGSGAGHSFRCYERLVYEGDTLHLLGTSDGLFSTKKLEGANTIWMREGANSIGKAVIEDIEVRELDGRIVIATHGNGLFKTNYATSVQDFDGNNLGFVVSEVYPNPASNQINFVVNSDNASFVEAKLVDLNGRKIATIISEDFTGTKKVNYNINDLNAGIYFLQISDGNHFVTKKVNIVR